jgi:2-haloacid dehalogenase
MISSEREDPNVAIRGLLFDVFGTLVDWRSSVSRQTKDLLSPLGISLPWEAFADAWRAEYQPALEEVRSGREAFCLLDEIHRRTLKKVLLGFRIEGLNEAILNAITMTWHQLDAWPDVHAGLVRLQSRFRLAPCSNGNISLVSDLSRCNRWTWTAILGAEPARDYKPRPSVYLKSAADLGCTPGDALMVAAHPLDLRAAASVGMKTAFIPRPMEHGTGTPERLDGLQVDWIADSLTQLADQLGCGE